MMMVKCFKFKILILIFWSVNLYAQNPFISPHGNNFSKEIFIDNTDTLNYRLLKPENFDSTKKYPLILFLHGSGERGWHNEDILLKHGADFFMKPEHRKTYPCFVLIPQCKPNSWWSQCIRDTTKKEDTVDGIYSFPYPEKISKDLFLVSKLVKSMSKQPFINKNKIAVGGLSMGAMGCFEILWRMPKFFSCAFAICGGGHTNLVKKYAKNFPIKLFHGKNDKVVLPTHSQRMYEALKANKAKVELILYDGVGHNSWVNAFNHLGLMQWITEQKLK